MGGIFWRLWRKRIVLWRNHVLNGYSTWIAAHLAQAVCYTSPSAYTAQFKNSVQMPIGIDTTLFSPHTQTSPPDSILFFGRLDEVKHPDIFVQALERTHERGVPFSAEIVGDPTYADSSYAHTLRNRVTTLMLENVLLMQPGVLHAQAPALFAAHAIYVNLTPAGSFDKTIGEAMAAGAIVVVGNDAVRGIVPDDLIVAPFSVDSVVHGLSHALALSGEERRAIVEKQRTYVQREHSLSLLIERLFGILSA
jgi:glycosyltransferase involved in cell wall biosynthesis